MTRPSTPNINRAIAALLLAAAVAPWTAAAQPQDYLTRTFTFPADEQVAHEGGGPNYIHVWDWEALTADVVANGLVTVHWRLARIDDPSWGPLPALIPILLP